jgi:hypothetical protein
MAKKARKRLGQDLKVGDKVLLPQPEVELIAEVDPKEHGFRRLPKGTKTEGYVIFGDNEKVDCVYRPSAWEKMQLWLKGKQSAYQAKQEAVRKQHAEIPPLFQKK